MYMFIKMARWHSRLYAAMYGAGHSGCRQQSVARLSDIREDVTEFHTAAFIAEIWERVTFQYNIFVAEVAHCIIGQYDDDGATFEKLKIFALTPGIGAAQYGATPQRLFFDIPEGFRQLSALPDAQQAGRRRDIQTLVAPCEEWGEPRRWKKLRERMR